MDIEVKGSRVALTISGKSDWFDVPEEVDRLIKALEISRNQAVQAKISGLMNYLKENPVEEK